MLLFLPEGGDGNLISTQNRTVWSERFELWRCFPFPLARCSPEAFRSPCRHCGQDEPNPQAVMLPASFFPGLLHTQPLTQVKLVKHLFNLVMFFSSYSARSVTTRCMSAVNLPIMLFLVRAALQSMMWFLLMLGLQFGLHFDTLARWVKVLPGDLFSFISCNP